jgi:hypothetical protein
MDREVSISCGGKAVPMNDFVKEIVGNTVAALVASLKKGEMEGEIVVRLGAAQGKSA